MSGDCEPEPGTAGVYFATIDAIQLHGGPAGDPLRIYADRFSGHYGNRVSAAISGIVQLEEA
jgi:hypothetical protein